MYSLPENLSIDLSLCVNCNETGNKFEINITNSEGTDCRVSILNVKVVDALEYLYKISWSDFTEKLNRHLQSGKNEYLNLDNDLKIVLCQTCAPLVAENYRLQNNLESLSHSRSLLHLAKQLCQSDSGNSLTLNSDTNQNKDSNLINEDEDVDNAGINEFPFAEDEGSGKEGCDENFYDDDIEIKYEPPQDLLESHAVKIENELRVVLHKLPQPTVLKKKAVTSKGNTSSKGKNNKPKCLKPPSTAVSEVGSRTHGVRQQRRITKRKTTSEIKREKVCENIFDGEKVPPSAKKNVDKEKRGNSGKRKRKLGEKDDSKVLEPDGEDSSPKSVVINESRAKLPPKKRQRKTKTEKIDKIPREYCCTLCPEVFSKSKLLAIHKRSHKTPILITPDNPEEPFTCELCGKVCKNFKFYKYYHLRRHRENYEMSCHLCGKTFFRQYLLTHVRTVHLNSEDKKVECPTCGKKFPKHTIRHHIKIHKEDRTKFVCEICGKIYSFQEKYKLHMLLHNPNPPTCKFCGKIFPGKYALERHEQRHSDDNKPFACDVCGKSFRANYMLVRHKVMHQEDRPFQCLKCGKSFKSAEYLSMHDKGAHEKIRPAQKDYPCSICGMNFKNNKQLKTHQDADHNTENASIEHRIEIGKNTKSENPSSAVTYTIVTGI